MLHRIVVLGDGGVGKSAVILQFLQSKFVPDYDPTIEDTFRKQVIVDKKACVLEILDTAGQEEFVSLRDQWIRDGDAFILVFAMNSIRSFEVLKDIKKQINRVKQSDSVPVVFVGNKSDLDRKLSQDVVLKYCKQASQPLPCRYYETSAKTGANVENVFFSVVRAIRSLESKKESKKCFIL